MANASSNASGNLESHIISASNPLSPDFFQQLAHAGPLDETSNYPGSVRHYIYGFGNRNRADNTLVRAMLFFIYQTARHGPQNGFRLCVVQSGFHIASATKSAGDGEDDIDRLEKEIPQGHMEVVFLGPKPADYPESEDE